MVDFGFSYKEGDLYVTPRGRAVIMASIAAIIAAIFILDISTMLGIAVGMLYVIPIIMSTLTYQRWLPVILAVVTSALTVVGAPLKAVNFPGALDVVIPNRIMMITIIWATTVVAWFHIRRIIDARDARQNLHQKVEERTYELSDTVAKLETEVKERAAVEEELRRTKDGLEITVRQRTAELEMEKERLLTTLRSIGDAVIATDVRERITIMNRVAEVLTGWTLAEAMGRPLDDVFKIYNERTRKKVESPVKLVLERGEVIGLANHTILIDRDGLEIPIGDSGAPIIDSSGKLAGVVLVFRDMTLEKKKLEELERAQRMESLGLLAGGIAHDFNNVLTALEGNIELARIKASGNTEAVERLADASKATARARQLTRQLLTFARGGEPVKARISVKDILVDNVRFALSGSNITSQFNIEDGLWKIDADEGQIAQVIHNLALNAREAMPQGGVLKVSAENSVYKPEHGGSQPGKYVMISISDTGVGIPAGYLGKVFDPYFSTKQNGRGLGLTIVFSIIKKHDGHVRVYSKVGEGTTFVLYLPASEGAEEVAERPAAAVGPDGKCILWMDDEEAIREIGREFLTLAGYHSRTATRGEEAIEMYKRSEQAGRPYDAVILDLFIPGGMHGKDTLVKLKEMNPQLKAIVCSGYYSDPVMANYRKFGFDGVLQKPFTVRDLTKVLDEVLNRPTDNT